MRRAVQCVKPCISSLRSTRWIRPCLINKPIHQSFIRPFSAEATHLVDQIADPLPPLHDRVRVLTELIGDEEETTTTTTEEGMSKEEEEELPEIQAPSLFERLEALPQLYTTATFSEHNDETISQYFLLSTEQLTRVPSSLKAEFDPELSITNGYMMIRESYLPLVQSLAAYNTPKGHYALRKPLGLDGKAGSGKSATLYYLYQWAVANNWLAIHIKAEDFMREQLGWLTANAERDGIMDQPMYTQVWLKQLADLQSDQLRRIPVTARTDVDWTLLDNRTNSQSSNSSRTLLDLINLSLVDVTQAPRILYQLVDEIRHQNEVPVLVMIDNLNMWDSVSEFIDPTDNYKPLPARRLALVDAWSVFQHVAPALGTSVFATTSHGIQKQLKQHFNLNKVRAKQVQPYNDQELKHSLVHYNVSGVMLETVNEELIGRVKGLSGGLPREVQKIAMQL